MTPTPRRPTTTPTGKYSSPITERPNANPPTPSPDKIKPMKSNGCVGSIGTFGMKRVAIAKPTRPIGMLMRNIQCQEA